MRGSAKALLTFFHERSTRGDPLVLATVVGTEGSTYRKPGAQMLIAADGSSSGLLSGGCLENDLIERAQRVLSTSTAEIVTYDARTSDDPVWGLGLGCEGAMQILLQRLDAARSYQPLAFAAACIARHQRGAFALVVESRDRRYRAGDVWHSASLENTAPAAQIVEHCQRRADQGGFETVTVGPGDQSITAFIASLELPTRLLILGAGADAEPVVEIATLHGVKAELNIQTIMGRRLTITGSTLRPRPVAEKAVIAAELLEHVWPLLESGVVAPIVHATFPLRDAAEAHRVMESSAHIGKLLLVT